MGTYDGGGPKKEHSQYAKTDGKRRRYIGVKDCDYENHGRTNMSYEKRMKLFRTFFVRSGP